MNYDQRGESCKTNTYDIIAREGQGFREHLSED